MSFNTTSAQVLGDRNQEATVWVGNLEAEVDEEILWELCTQAGPVASMTMPRDNITREHSSYAFVEFKNEVDADYAMKTLNMIRLFGKSIKVNKASRENKEQDIGANVFVGNLDPEVDEQLLYSTFSAFGQVAEAKVMYDDDGNPRGFGFIKFAGFDSADAAIMAMNGQYLSSKPLHVGYAFKRDGSKGERHGSTAERMLATSLQSGDSRPNMLFAAEPKTAGAAASAQSSAPPPMMMAPPSSSPPPGAFMPPPGAPIARPPIGGPGMMPPPPMPYGMPPPPNAFGGMPPPPMGGPPNGYPMMPPPPSGYPGAQPPHMMMPPPPMHMGGMPPPPPGGMPPPPNAYGGMPPPPPQMGGHHMMMPPPPMGGMGGFMPPPPMNAYPAPPSMPPPPVPQ